MLSALNQRLLSLAKAKIRPVTCPNCGERFTPFADREIVGWSDFVGASPCPQCGRGYSLQSSRDEESAPSGPLPQPEGSRIEKKPVAEGQILYFIPASGSGGGLLAFAVLWNAFLVLFLAGFLFGKSAKNDPPGILVLFLLPFIAVGIGMTYAGLRAKYATHLLFLGPGFVRLQRQLFGRSKTYDLTTAEIDRAERKEFYQQNYQPVYGIEIGAGKRRIRFGTALTNDEKQWLSAEIREFLRETGNPSFPATSPESLDTGTQAGAVERLKTNGVVGMPPEKTQIIREVASADEVIYHIPACRRWGVLLPVGLIFAGVFGVMFSQAVREIPKTIRAADNGFVIFGLIGALIDSAGTVISGVGLLTGLVMLYWAIRSRYLRHQLTLNRQEVRLDSILFRAKSRSIPLADIEQVELFELFKSNGKPVYAIRVLGRNTLFHFGFRLSDEEKLWLAAEMETFVKEKSAVHS